MPPPSFELNNNARMLSISANWKRSNKLYENHFVVYIWNKIIVLNSSHSLVKVCPDWKLLTPIFNWLPHPKRKWWHPIYPSVSYVFIPTSLELVVDISNPWWMESPSCTCARMCKSRKWKRRRVCNFKNACGMAENLEWYAKVEHSNVRTRVGETIGFCPSNSSFNLRLRWTSCVRACIHEVYLQVRIHSYRY